MRFLAVIRPIRWANGVQGVAGFSGVAEARTHRAPKAHYRTVGSIRAPARLSLDPHALRETSEGCGAPARNAWVATAAQSGLRLTTYP